ncbi:MAG: triose-phosphate isomerase [Bacteroidetes bacterium]|nr:triose-phosphate isomerase [Bacteroidota bacterium]
MRNKIVAGNWKMYKSPAESAEFAKSLVYAITNLPSNLQVFVFPTTISLQSVQQQLVGSAIKSGAQNIHQENEGAFTGEISAAMVASIEGKATLIGHSERREYFNESNHLLSQKMQSALNHNLIPFYCCGEKLEERQASNHFNVVKAQLVEGLKGVSIEQMQNVVIAYEPVWAIGTGVTATPAQAEEMHAFIRKTIEQLYSAKISHSISILYGGSVKPANASELFACKNIDGALVGGASLVVDDFKAIVEAMC